MKARRWWQVREGEVEVDNDAFIGSALPEGKKERTAPHLARTRSVPTTTCKPSRSASSLVLPTAMCLCQCLHVNYIFHDEKRNKKPRASPMK